jgi:hypothetical protein
MMEAVRTSETSVNFNMTTRRYIPEDPKLHVLFSSLQQQRSIIDNIKLVINASSFKLYTSCKKKVSFSMRFQVLMAMSMNRTVFWDVAPCSLTQVDQHFKEALIASILRP